MVGEGEEFCFEGDGLEEAGLDETGSNADGLVIGKTEDSEASAPGEDEDACDEFAGVWIAKRGAEPAQASVKEPTQPSCERAAVWGGHGKENAEG